MGGSLSHPWLQAEVPDLPPPSVAVGTWLSPFLSSGLCVPLKHWNLQGPSSGVLGATLSAPGMAAGFGVDRVCPSPGLFCLGCSASAGLSRAGRGSPERVGGAAPPLQWPRSVPSLKGWPTPGRGALFRHWSLVL